MIVLGIDSSSDAATAAVVSDGKLLCEYTQNQKKTHSVKMLPMVENMLRDVGISLDSIDVFACGIGPGSFTGVRIGVATVRAFCDTLEKPAVAVTSLLSLYENVKFFDGTVIALIFARENECFAAAFKDNKEILAPCIMTIDEIIDFSKDTQCLFVGDGAEMNYDALSKINGARFASSQHNIISAASIAQIGYQKALAGVTGNSSILSPLYLRKSQAEREYEEKHKNTEDI